jgi:hypothetical protein
MNTYALVLSKPNDRKRGAIQANRPGKAQSMMHGSAVESRYDTMRYVGGLRNDHDAIAERSAQ